MNFYKKNKLWRIDFRDRFSKNPHHTLIKNENFFDEHFSELEKMKTTNQPEQYHPEITVFNHTKNVVKCSGCFAEDEVFYWGCLLHDVGKIFCTEFIDGRWRSHGHAKIGSEVAEEILLRFWFSKKDIRTITWLIENHMMFFQQISKKKIESFLKHPYIHYLLKLHYCDKMGSNQNLTHYHEWYNMLYKNEKSLNT